MFFSVRLQPRSSFRARMLPQSGFTMVELMVTVGLLVVLMSVAVPSFQAVIQGNRIINTICDYSIGGCLSKC